MSELAAGELGATTLGPELLPLKPLAELRGLKRSRFCVGAVTVEIAADCEGDIDLVPSLEPFRSDTHPDVRVRVEWVDQLLSVATPELFNSSSTWRLYGSDAEFQFDFGAPFFGELPYKRLLADRAFTRATLLMSRRSFAGLTCDAVPLGYPLDELLIMHRLTQERAIELHGCGITTADGTGNLFVGHSGAGKSTTTRLWTASEDVEILSDDRIIVREHPGHVRMYGTPWHGEAMFASPNSNPLTRIMILEHGHGNVLTRLSPSRAVGELFARSFVPMHRHEYVESALEFLQTVAESVPCYRFAFEPHQGAVEKILALRD